MKRKEINQTWKCPIYRVTVHFLTGDSKKAEKFCKGLALEDGWAAGGVWEIEKKNKDNMIEKEFLVWIEDKTNFFYMVHETAHLVQRIFEFVGVTYSQTNKEAIAYYQEYWVRKFWHVMDKKVECKVKVKKPKLKGKVKNG